MRESNEPAHAPPRQRVLVADDDPKSRTLFGALLESEGYDVLLAEDGEAALQKATAARPDVVLLDVMMPKLDGVSVCRRLKENPATASIPVLMITALTERNERLQGMQAGANDYLFKPADIEDMRLRVRNAARLKHLHECVREELERIRKLEELRDNLVKMVVHDMRSPLTAVLGSLELLRTDGACRGSGPADLLRTGISAVRELIGMCNNLLDVSRLEAGCMPVNREFHDLRDLARSALETVDGSASRHGPAFTVEGSSVTAAVDAELIRRVLVNLLNNAMRHTPPGGRVTVSLRAGETAADIEVRDTGSGIPVEDQGAIFEKFRQGHGVSSGQAHSAGLGLTFCKLAIEAHGGAIGVESEPDRGSVFRVTLPLQPPGIGGCAESEYGGSCKTSRVRTAAEACRPPIA